MKTAKITDNPTLKPRPVHPKAVKHHGLFGKAFVRQHMVVDERWSPDSLTQQFAKMSGLLQKHYHFNSLDKKVRNRELVRTCHKLQKECRDGRSILKTLRAGCKQEVRNILADHRQMQRLYQKMPLHLAEENINQRTFVMRKERDRLQDRLKQLEAIYATKLLQKANLENRLQFENEFRLEEEERIDQLMKENKNFEIRLKANKAINATYKQIIQILLHDQTFYMPILRSLQADVEDQSQFISHILYLGTPAIARFRELSDQYKTLEDIHRKKSRQSLQQISGYHKKLSKPQPKELKPLPHRDNLVRVRNYVRETKSMLNLKAKFEEIEDTIKKIKMATICSDEKVIFSRIKSQVKNNLDLGSKIENDMLGHEVMETRMKGASVLKEVLVNNLAENEIMRLNKIKKLKEDIAAQDEIQKNLLIHIKNVANIFVLLRLSLWNLHEIMRYVGPKQITHPEYPVDHLKLPLLQYEMLPMKSYPPDAFEQNIMKLLQQVFSKLKRLTKSFDWKLDKGSILSHHEEFCQEMIGVGRRDSLNGQDVHYRIDREPELDMMDVKLYKTVPNRSDIKLLSARFVEECIKRDE